jgi:hypothetical protein
MAQNQQTTVTNGELSQIPSLPSAYNPGPPPVTGNTFGIALSEQVVSEGTEIPKVVEKCAQAIEAYGELYFGIQMSLAPVTETSSRSGLDQMGIYRLSGTTSKVQRLKAALDVGRWTYFRRLETTNAYTYLFR